MGVIYRLEGVSGEQKAQRKGFKSHRAGWGWDMDFVVTAHWDVRDGSGAQKKKELVYLGGFLGVRGKAVSKVQAWGTFQTHCFEQGLGCGRWQEEMGWGCCA